MAGLNTIDIIRYKLELKEYFDKVGYDNVELIFIESKKWLDHEFRQDILEGYNK